MWGYLAVVVCAVGAVVYLVATNPKFAELGRISFGAGLLTFLLQNGTHIISLASGR
jgi:Na+/phosphate symporter